jgi:aerobic carbon-monoxide dehydrogenase large subunit
MKYVGQSIPGQNNKRHVSGKGQFAGDIQLPRQTWLALTRSPYAHARITSIDTSEAEAVAGVIAIVLGDELEHATPSTGIMRDPGGPGTQGDAGPRDLRTYALAIDEVLYSGHPVAAVIAEDRYTAQKAAELIDVEYDELPVVTDARTALKPEADLALPGWDNNLIYHQTFNKGDAESALGTSTHRIKDTVKVHRHLPLPLEPRAFVADFDVKTERLTLWASTQMPHVTRTLLSYRVGLQSEQVKVIQPDVGGGFGTKSPGSDEEFLCAFLSKRLGRPVKWVEERTEYFMVCGHARQTEFDFDVGFDDNGKITGLTVDVITDVGIPQGAWVQSFVTAFVLPGVYQADDCRVDLSVAATNKCKWGGYRGFGKEVASFMMERVMDRIADHTALDRIAVRERNLIQPEQFPYSQVSGALLDSGDYPGALEKLREIMDLDGFKVEQAAARKEGRYLGFGLAFELTPEGCSMPKNDVLQGWDGSTVRIDPLARVTVLTGVTSPGSGNETGIAQIVADTLGMPMDAISVVQGDTDRCPYGLGNFSSRSTMIGGSAAMLAAQDLREKILIVAGNVLQKKKEDLDISEGVVSAADGSGGSISVFEVSQIIHKDAFGAEAEEIEPGLESTRYYKIGNVFHQPETQGRFSTYPTWPYMVAAAVVEVDPQSGFVKVLKYRGVHDCGTVINPMLVEANGHGALAQSIGGTLFEELKYDENGQLLTTTLMDYTIPTAVEMPPEVNLRHHVTPSPATPLGTKGAGESGVAAPMGAIASAIESALPELNLELMELPFKPERIWSEIEKAKAATGIELADV